VRIALPSKKTAFKWVLRILGLLVLSAISNGVWESLLRPAIHASSRWVLDLASFGVTNYKNGVYQQIAADNQSAVALETLVWVTFMSMLLIGFYVGYTAGQAAATRSRIQALQGAPPSPESDITDILKLSRGERFFLYVTLLGLGLLLGNHLVSMARLSYVNSAEVHYHHVLRIALPFLDGREQVEVESDFAQIGSRDDYVKVLSRLESLCKTHGRTVPKFDPW
jgi:hypothetical protein